MPSGSVAPQSPPRSIRLDRSCRCDLPRRHSSGRVAGRDLFPRRVACASSTLLTAAAAQLDFRAVQFRRIPGWHSLPLSRWAGRQDHAVGPCAFHPRRQQLAGADGAEFPFWSPDSDRIGFFADGKLKTAVVARRHCSGSCQVQHGIGGTWNSDGTIVFASSVAGPLHRISAAGGVPRP